MAMSIFSMTLKLCQLQWKRTQATKVKYHVKMLGTVENYSVPSWTNYTFLYKWKCKRIKLKGMWRIPIII